MLKLREILRNSLIAKFLVHLFVYNFFTCQCLAMIPREMVAKNFHDNIDTLFHEIDVTKDYLSMHLHRSESNGFELSLVKEDEHAQKTEKKSVGTIVIQGNDVQLQFKFANNINPIIFDLVDGATVLSYLDDRISLFESNEQLLIKEFQANNDLKIKAKNFKVLEQLQSDHKLHLIGSNLYNEGEILAPRMIFDIDNLKNSGNITGRRVKINSKDILFSKRSFVNAKQIDVQSRGSLTFETASVQSKKLNITAPRLLVKSGAMIRASEFILWSNLFLNDGSECSLDDAILTTNLFINDGHIQAKSFDAQVKTNQILYGQLAFTNHLMKYTGTTYDNRFGTFLNVGTLSSNQLDVETERYFLNQNGINVRDDFNINARADFVNKGFILQTGSDTNSSIKSTKFINEEGRLELAGNLSLTGLETKNQKGVIHANDIDIKLALNDQNTFIKNRTEEALLNVESNDNSKLYESYREVSRVFKPSSDTPENNSKQENSNNESTNNQENANHGALPNIGFIDNNGGKIEARHNVRIKGAGPIFNGEAGKISATNKMRINTFGRLVNQFNSRIDGTNIKIRSKGSVFNTLGANINGNIISILCDSFQNGVGANITGQLRLKSQKDILNDGEFLLSEFGESILCSKEGSIFNQGSVNSGSDLSFVSNGWINDGKVNAIGNIILNTKKFINRENALLGSEKNISLIAKNAEWLNKRRISGDDVIFENVIPVYENNSAQTQNSNGILTAKNRLRISTNNPVSTFENLVVAKIFEFKNAARGTVALNKVLNNSGISPTTKMILKFPNALVENQENMVISSDTEIIAESFRNLALLRGEKDLKILTANTLINGIDYNKTAELYPLLYDWDVEHNKVLSTLVEDNSLLLVKEKAKQHAVISSEGNLTLKTNNEITNTGSIIAQILIWKPNLSSMGGDTSARKQWRYLIYDLNMILWKVRNRI